MKCVECGEEDDFEYGDGTGYCRVCGTQSQDIREEIVDFNETLFSTANKSIRRVAKGLDSSRSRLQPERMWTIPEAVQIVLLLHTKTLISKLSLPSHFQNIVGNLWIRFLAKIGSTTVIGIDTVPLTEQYKVTIFDSFSVLFLSLLHIHYPVTISDILDWVTDGTLCYFHTERHLPEYFKPRKLLDTALGVRTFPSIECLSERVTILSEILDDVTIPVLSPASLDRIFCKVLRYFAVASTDVHLVCLALFQKFYMTTNLLFASNLSIATSFLMSLRLYFQFETPISDKEKWLSWFEPYLRDRHQNKVSRAATATLPPNMRCSAMTNHFLNLTQSEYVKKVRTITSDHAHVLGTDSAVQEIREMFIPHFGEILRSSEVGSGGEHRTFREKNEVKRGGKGRKVKNPRNSRIIVIYPIDEIIPDSILPLELEILLKDVAAHFYIGESVLFKELQRLARLCE